MIGRDAAAAECQLRNHGVKNTIPSVIVADLCATIDIIAMMSMCATIAIDVPSTICYCLKYYAESKLFEYIICCNLYLLAICNVVL